MTDIEYLKTLQAVRDRANLVQKAAEQGELTHFNYNAARMPAVAEFVADVITRDYGPNRFDKIPPHGRWQHFNVGQVPRVENLSKEWENAGCDKLEVTRRLVDLFFVSVLLDAGAGEAWSFTEPESGNTYVRSEGIAIAAMSMLKGGAFSSQPGETPARVDGHGLIGLDIDTFRKYFQITPGNPILGDTPRVTLLNSVGSSLLALPQFFGKEGRPGQVVDYLVKNRSGSEPLDFDILWAILQKLLLPAWPKDRTQVNGVPIGDSWPLKVLERMNAGQKTENGTAHIQPFHKLTQWLAYSVTIPFIRILGLEWKNIEHATALPEYRNGGIFVDLGVLQLKEETLKEGLASSKQVLPSFGASSDPIVEWRAMTISLTDKLLGLVNERFASQNVKLTIPQMLEAGTWKGGRELAAKLRPQTRSSPILIEGDGTLF